MNHRSNIVYNKSIITYKNFKPNKKQQEYIKHLSDKEIPVVLGVGPAGTGKTLLACNVGLENLMNNQIKKLIITRPTVSVGQDIGYLPGSLEDKMDPWMIPIYDSFKEHISLKTLSQCLNTKSIEICPLTYIRGRTFHDSYIIADEMQNSSIMEMKTLLTRIGKDSKMVLTGDIDQSDLPINSISGLEDLLIKLNKKKEEIDNDFLKLVQFDIDDVERSEVVKYFLKMYKD